MEYEEKEYLIKSSKFSLKVLSMLESFDDYDVDKRFYEDFVQNSLPVGFQTACSLNVFDYLFLKDELYIIREIGEDKLVLESEYGDLKTISAGHWVFNPRLRELRSQ